jgi:hypothetical protein
MAQAASRSQQGDPHHHVHKMQGRFAELIDHLRSDIEKIDEPRFKAMSETSAEVLAGLSKAFQDYEKKNEAAWR